jgi:group I intron endonuclease
LQRGWSIISPTTEPRYSKDLKHSGIYKIQSKKKPSRCYVGSAKNMALRWASHLYNLKRGKHHTPKLQHHYDKYGKNDLEFSVLLCCDIEDLIITEQFFIDALSPWFNHRKKADSNLGMKYSEESKARMRGKHWRWSDESRLKMKGNKNGIGNKGAVGKAPPNKGISKYANDEERRAAHRIVTKNYYQRKKLAKTA